GGMGWTSAQR
ncbi:hypothetical protein CLOM_g18395, partial [Closterium sp. NIES-68]